jgi:sigma-B regulation protein RsbU (phosphoserine phosphatase)
VDRAVHGNYDFILLASDLPRLDGIEATRILKNYAQTREVPVLLLIPQGDSEQENFAFDSGASDVISKPVNMLAFARKTRSILQL